MIVTVENFQTCWKDCIHKRCKIWAERIAKMQIVIAGGKADSFQTCFKQMKGEVVDNVFVHPFLHTAITFLFCFFIPNLMKEWHMVQKKTDGLKIPTGYIGGVWGSLSGLHYSYRSCRFSYQLRAWKKEGHLLDLNHLLTAALTNSSSRLSVAILAAEEPQVCFFGSQGFSYRTSKGLFRLPQSIWIEQDWGGFNL